MTLVGVGLPAGGGAGTDSLVSSMVGFYIYGGSDAFLLFLIQDPVSGWALGGGGVVSAASPEMSEMSMSVGNSLFWRIS